MLVCKKMNPVNKLSCSNASNILEIIFGEHHKVESWPHHFVSTRIAQIVPKVKCEYKWCWECVNAQSLFTLNLICSAFFIIYNCKIKLKFITFSYKNLNISCLVCFCSEIVPVFQCWEIHVSWEFVDVENL